MKRKRAISYGLAALVVSADQFSKAWAVGHLSRRGLEPFLPGLLDLQLTYNTGAAFSLFSGSSFVLGMVSLAVALGVVVWLQLQRQIGPWQLVAVGLLLGGAIGNGIDRWRLGAVIDFLALVPIQFPVFNLADVAINGAVACFLIDLLPLRRRP